ncbi:MAG TPA: hypothetical protein VMI33_07470 [Streptosporangiaceae bacterium]|nr:hypothetical protein [Streptosporangiaceae bacterium]
MLVAAGGIQSCPLTEQGGDGCQRAGGPGQTGQQLPLTSNELAQLVQVPGQLPPGMVVSGLGALAKLTSLVVLGQAGRPATTGWRLPRPRRAAVIRAYIHVTSARNPAR